MSPNLGSLSSSGDLASHGLRLTKHFSITIDEVLNSEEVDTPTDVWKSELADKIEEIIDRKRSSNMGRETSLGVYARILTSRYAEEDIQGRETELVTSFLKSIKAEVSEAESVLAMKGM